MMKKIAFLLSSLIFITACARKQPLQFSGTTMGTTYVVRIADKLGTINEIQSLKKEVDDILIEVNRQMSTYLHESEISRFNRQKSTDPFVVSPGFVKILQVARRIFEESSGAFDITIGPLVELWGFGGDEGRTVPPRAEQIRQVKALVGMEQFQIINDSTIAKSNPDIEIDLNAIAKGYGVDIVADLLANERYKNYLVEIGGEVAVKGMNGGQKWKIGIDRPTFGSVPGQKLEAVLQITDISIATSGDYRNYFIYNDTIFSHTIDPVTARPVANSVASVTVLAPNCTLADAIATAITVMGEERGLAWVETLENVEAMLILRDTEGNLRENQSTNFHEYQVVD